ncbi:hypothetical protein Acr_14g0005900 [Actinidia rufa]|uniref:Uncharacterized protein n=1 Tax=Actinidia rufa TaxID=165716 RepID=A0A7J0FQG1_9ERIC|nr:hypothetical protein Acr_14g0005900 [Actinidia rufa]
MVGRGRGGRGATGRGTPIEDVDDQGVASQTQQGVDRGVTSRGRSTRQGAGRGKPIPVLFQRAVSSSLRLKQGMVDLKKANQKASNLEKELKLKQTQSELADAWSAAEIAILQRNHAQQEASDLKAFACGEVYRKLFDRAFERAGDVYERQLAELRPGRYSPINLPDFNEEEYATLPAAEGNANAAAVEAQAGVAETADRHRAGEAVGDRALEAEEMPLSPILAMLLYLKIPCKLQGSEASVPKSSVAFELQSGIRPVLAVRKCPLRHLRTRRVSKSCGVMPYLEATIHKA